MTTTFHNTPARLLSCGDVHCRRCLVCAETHFEEQRSGAAVNRTAPDMKQWYQALYLFQIRQRINGSK